jgi:TonB family protein
MPSVRAAALVGGLSFLLAAPACAQSLGKPGSFSVIGPYATRLSARPTDAEVMAAWPAAAKARNLGGSAVIHCTVTPDGALADCAVMIERSHAGFGAALLSLMPRFKIRPFPAGEAPDRSDMVITASWPQASSAADWETPPKAGDFSTSYTPAAWRASTPGEATMNCFEAKTGTLHDCMAVYQDPVGKGFGAMVLRFASFLRLKPAMLDGKPIETGINIGMNFEAPAHRGAPSKP